MKSSNAIFVLVVAAALLSLVTQLRTTIRVVSSAVDTVEALAEFPLLKEVLQYENVPNSSKNENGTGLELALSSPNVANESSRSSRPHFVLHLGPGKTGSTSLQCALTHLYDHQFLEQDNYHYLGRIVVDCAYNTTKRPPTLERTRFLSPQFCHKTKICRKGVKSYLDQQYRSRKNIVLSQEGYSGLVSTPWDQQQVRYFYRYLVESVKDWDAEFVLSYRRFHEWLLSAKHEQDAGLDREWPQKGIPRIQPVWSHLQEIIRKDFEPLRHQYTGTVLDRLGDILNLRILNVHEEDSVQQFLCDVLRAPNTCAQYKLQEVTTRTHITLDRSYDTVTMAAYDRNLFRNSSSLVRHEVNQLVQKRQEGLGQSSIDFPWKCPAEDELKELLQMSLDYEKKIVPDYYYAEGKRLHEESFWDAVKKKKFCTVDTNKLLEDDGWVEFFRSL